MICIFASMSPFFVPLLVASAAAATRPDNVAALCELYFATEGPTSWVDKGGWSGCFQNGTAATDPCDDGWFSYSGDPAATTLPLQLPLCGENGCTIIYETRVPRIPRNHLEAVRSGFKWF